jgi:hypothetical protein
MTLAQVQAAVIGAITPKPTDPFATLKLLAIASTAQTPLAFVPRRRAVTHRHKGRGSRRVGRKAYQTSNKRRKESERQNADDS